MRTPRFPYAKRGKIFKEKMSFFRVFLKNIGKNAEKNTGKKVLNKKRCFLWDLYISFKISK
jgi:hypothetical protein